MQPSPSGVGRDPLRGVANDTGSLAPARPQAKSAKLCQEGAVKNPWNKPITRIPNNEAGNVSTAMSLNRRVGKRNYYLTGVKLPWHETSKSFRSLQSPPQMAKSMPSDRAQKVAKTLPRDNFCFTLHW